MVSQNIEQLLLQAIDQSMAQTQESRELAEGVTNTIGDIRKEASDTVKRVDAAIPAAVNSEMYQQLYLDPINGDDSGRGILSEPFKTLKALLDSTSVGSTVVVRGANDMVIEVNEDIHLVNKKVVIYLVDCTLNMNARFILSGSFLKNHYNFKAINQTVDCVFYHFSAEIRVSCQGVSASGDATHLFKTGYTGGYVDKPGSHHSNILFEGTVNDAESEYYVFGPSHYKSSMIVTTYSLTLGANVVLFDPIYSFMQVGTKGVYLVGA
ncbi:hypothetical protein AB6C54_12200 [Vibrio splendidus]|uniref:hypothetical protein n=1 Tax=Vibrio splendidus TaxID=29497 RepID=UPI000D390FFD|nr:hypothetical protein [Vibrio splendidus]PTO79516.1 hypothetical protein CWN93_17890 [Vibrio splendidus]